MSRRSETGAAARWERQEADREKKRKQKKEQEELERAVQEAPKPADSFLSAIISENFRGSMERLAGQSIRISEAIANFAQNPTIQELLNQAEAQNQRNLERHRAIMSFFGGPVVLDPRVPEGFIAFDEATYINTAGRNGGMPEARSYRHDFGQLPPDERRQLFEPVRIEPDQNMVQDRYSSWLLGRLESGLDRQFLGGSNYVLPKPPGPDQMQAKVARAQKLLIDSSNLLSRVIAGLEVTPDEAKALKARLDAGIQAFIDKGELSNV